MCCLSFASTSCAKLAPLRSRRRTADIANARGYLQTTAGGCNSFRFICVIRVIRGSFNSVAIANLPESSSSRQHAPLVQVVDELVAHAQARIDQHPLAAVALDNLLEVLMVLADRLQVAAPQ